MSDLGDMTPEERRVWAARKQEESRREFADAPPVRVSRAKREEYARSHGVPFVLRLAEGLLVTVRGEGETEPRRGRLAGLRAVEGADARAAVVEIEDGGTWALLPAEGEGGWEPHPETMAVKVADRDVPVVAWSVPDAREPVPGPGRTARWTVRNVSVHAS